ncbi:amino acid ABC transporter permease [Microbacterium sp. STN6]|uniref:amino acid ABC transporter permease n=1 Tax=Microbacterium sp. STN6 TaxID=2995588 RepID=UPI002260C072|nr:amino acid ABC transporter permease [Microbacterium sp. STN6]MCX7521330.1 amino acid ABC transporter permease [Microbacterium sp. STN6]
MDAVIDSLPTYLKGFVGTLELLAISGVGALILGTIVAGLRISPIASLRTFAAVYTEVLRNIPLLLVLFFCGVVLPYLKVPLDYFPLALIGLTLYTSPFVAEAVRSGVNGVPVGQAEAARSIGLRFGQTLSLIVMPQAIRMVIPPLINVIIALAKNTSVAGGFFVYELFKAANDITNLRGDAVIVLLLGIAVLYLVITVPLGLIAGAVERRVAVLR